MSASSTTSTTDDNRSETEEFAGKGDGLLCRTPAILMPGSSSAYGISEFSTTGAANHVHRGLGPMVSTSTISTLDRSAYQSLPLSGTRRITVQFGDMKIVVPWKDSASSTVGDLTEAALLRYKRACGNPAVKIVRLECASDGGVLDQDDILEDVFDLAFDQILAITDEAGPQHHYAQPLPVNRSTSKPVASAYGSVSVQNPAPSSPSSTSINTNIIPYNIGHKSRRDSIVEVKNLASAVSPGLRVHKTPTAVRIGNDNEPMLRSSLRSEKKQERQQARVTLSPEVEKKLAERERPHYEKNTSANRLLRSSDRKSRINDAFLDSRDRLAEKYEQLEVSSQKPPVKLGPVAEGPVPGSTVVTFLAPENVDFGTEEIIGMGVEVNAVYDDSVEAVASTSNSKMTAVQIMKIDKDGRIGKDGRLKVGDNVIEIDGRPVYQMSILRARAYIADLAVSTKDATLTILRPIESFSDSDQIDQKPIFSALQAANTQYIGQTQVVELVKSSNGFGFTVTGRETAKGERLFYIGTVKPYGVALGHLKSGDRLLEINGESTGALTQLQIVDRLKEAMVGSKVRFLVSRVPATIEKDNEPPTSSEPPAPSLPKVVEPTFTEEEDPTSTKNSRFDLVIPLNDSGSAGLGVSLKARVSVKSDGSRHDCGIFIKNVMHGGAAFKDGKLKVNDRIIGIEDIELELLKNSAASDALTKKLKSIGPSSSHVKLSIIRESPSSTRKPGPISRDSSRITVDAASSSPTPSSSRITTPASFITSPHPTTTSGSHSRQTSSEMSAKEGEEEAMNETVLNGEVDPFDREAPGRKSLSEKRGIGAATGDPQHIKLFQEIKHQRQNSAPPASTSRSASEKRSKSQPRSMSQRNYYHRRQQQQQMKNSETPEPPSSSTLPREKPIDAGGIVNRRSLSMESINPKPGPLTAVTFSTPNGKEHPFPPGGSPSMRVKNEDNRSRDKSRRKSVGNAMRSFFGFGSKSRDASPEKQQPVQLTSADKIRQPVFMDYGDAYHQQPGPSGYEFAADAELYGRYAAHRYPPPPPDAENAFYWGRGGSRMADSPATNQQNAAYLNYGLPTSHSYHVTPTVFTGGGSYSAASLRRAYAQPPHQHHHQQQQQQQYDNDYFDDATYQQIIIGAAPQPPPPPQPPTGSVRQSTNYHNAFNTWFAYTGGGAIGAQPMLRNNNGGGGFGVANGANAKSYGSPVRIAAASTIRDAAYAQQYPRADNGGANNGRRSRNNDAQEKYADVRTAAKQSSDTSNGGGASTRFFIPRHGGGLAAASTFAASTSQHNNGSPASPSNQQFRRRGSGQQQQHRSTTAPQPPPHRFPQY